MLPADLPKYFRSRAQTLERYAPSAAEAFREAAEEVEAALHEWATGAVTLQEAHEIGGYSVDHLSREIREGRLPNAGRKGAPMLLRKDVPIKPGHVSVALMPKDSQSSSGARARRAARSLHARS